MYTANWRRLAAMGTALILVTLTIAACGDSDDSNGDDGEAQAPTATTPPEASDDTAEDDELAPTPVVGEDEDIDDAMADEEEEFEDPGWVDYDFEVIATELDIPWELVFLPDGDMLITERPGTVRLMRDGELQEDPILEFEDVVHERGAEGGLLGMTLHPEFDDNNWIYFYYTYEDDDEWRNRVVRYVVDDLEFSDREVIIDDLPGAFTHNGGRIKFGPDDKLYVTLGDAQRQEDAQDVDVLVGKILRLEDDGSIPDDNPFGDDSPVYASGLRNPQGITWHPETGDLYSSQHGPTGNDEFNKIEPGANYGWPDMQGFDGDEQDDFTLPVMASGDDTWAPSGSTFYEGDVFPQWRNEYLMAGLRSVTLHRINLRGDEPEMGPIVQGEFGRLRTVVEGPDGLLYLLTSNRDERTEPEEDDDRLIRIIPVE